MVLTLRIECVGGAYLREHCVRVFEIRGDATLDNLHWAIQHEVRFDGDHPYEFFIANSSSGAKRHHPSRNEDWEDMEKDFEAIKLAQVFPLGRKRLYYHFDFGDDWIFEIRKARGVKEPEAQVQYPRVIESIGPTPVQYPGVDESW
ncbi:MAG: hypothetical protein HYX75_19220 [Acidobacteria bacterium]|nr:hypothetical protein [Acidobacteriota bacterium]